jgi:RAMA domain-containing protein
MPTIRVSDEVFDELKRRAEAFVDTPDSVMRRVLGLTGGKATGKTGRLLPLLRSGALSVGDRLVWRRKQRGEVHVAVTTPNGCLELADGRIATSLSGACAKLSDNKSYDGWEEWRRESDDTLLDDLR